MNSKRPLIAAILLVFWFGFASNTEAQTTTSPLTVQISQESASLVAGDWIEFSTILHNNSDMTTPPLVAHLDVTAVKEGPYVDPEDWSTRRTQYLSPLAPGESTQLDWQIHTLVKGEFAIFVTVLSPEKAFSPTISPSLLAQVAPDKILPLNEVIPVVAIVPLFPLALLLFSNNQARRQRDKGKAITKMS